MSLPCSCRLRRGEAGVLVSLPPSLAFPTGPCVCSVVWLVAGSWPPRLGLGEEVWAERTRKSI